MKHQKISLIRSYLKRVTVPLLIFMVGLLLTSVLFWKARQETLEQLRKNFVIDAEARSRIIENALDEHLIDLEGLRNFYNASPAVSRGAFATFVSRTLKTRPGIQAFEWIPRITYPERSRFEAEARREGLPHYQIYQLDAKGNKVAAGPRRYYYPVYYVEPLAGNEPAVGFDLGSNPARLDALEIATESGQPVATEPIKLVQETGAQAGFLIYIPVYRQDMPLTTTAERSQTLKGFVLGVFRAGDAIEAAIRSTPEKGLFTELLDLSALKNEKLLHHFTRTAGQQKVVSWRTILTPAITLSYEHPFIFAGRQWLVEIIASPTYVHGHISLFYWLIPPTGVLLTLLLALYFGALLSHKERADALVVERTAALTKTTNMLQLIIEAIPIRVFWKDINLRYLGCNTPFARDAGFEQPQELLGKDDYAMGWWEQAELYRAADRKVMESRHPEMNIIEPQTTPAGATIWLNTSKVPLQLPNGEIFGVLGVYADITEHKQAEEEIHRQRDQLRALAALLSKIQEVERRQLAQDLHDQICQNLTTIDLTLETIKIKAQQEPLDLLLSRLSDASTLVEQTGEIARDIMEGLRPTVLEHYGLMGALRHLRGQFTQRTGLDLEIQGEGAVPRLAPPVELALFRITQEALANVSKHAKAHRVTVTLEVESDLVRLIIADDGIGFDQKQVDQSRGRYGWGLMTMSERAMAVGGHCRVESRVGQGTRVVVEMPMTNSGLSGQQDGAAKPGDSGATGQ